MMSLYFSLGPDGQGTRGETLRAVLAANQGAPWAASSFSPLLALAGRKSTTLVPVLTQGDAEAQRLAARTAPSGGATHRLAAMVGFTQDDGYVRGVVADAQALLRILPRLRP
jgi:hypothetical protein